ncbi:hypothetical protein PR048_013677 [Dryococelus australis]|uniref:Uncharacterized protein n=1 Tax=Dryococelus australis TaxID=614101 RepID=A0ABQ9HSU2_9NEOP|nr:hypothetical protein PR048_013677 [Dryococelus australis]
MKRGQFSILKFVTRKSLNLDHMDEPTITPSTTGIEVTASASMEDLSYRPNGNGKSMEFQDISSSLDSTIEKYDLGKFYHPDNSTLKMKQQDNRQRLILIVETILLCARQEIPFQGTNDSRPIDMDGTKPD